MSTTTTKVDVGLKKIKKKAWAYIAINMRTQSQVVIGVPAV